MFAFARNLVKQAEGIIGEDASWKDQQKADTPSHGFRVLHVDQGSMAREVGIESLFDFIIALNGHSLVHSTSDDIIASQEVVPDSQEFIAELNNCQGRYANLTIWSGKGQTTREIAVPISNGSWALGMTLQWTPLSAADHVWHILNVTPNSPAADAGLISHSDYIVAAENGLLAAGGEDLLGRVISRIVSMNSNPSIELYVYNHDYDIVRPVRIEPNPSWGGAGLLGCGVGYGLLHRLPAVATKLLPPGTIMFDSSYNGSKNAGDDSNLFVPGLTAARTQNESPELFVPAHTQGGTLLSADLVSPTAPAHAKKHRYAAIQKNDLQSYFSEEEERSRARDTVVASDGSSVAPPPKAK